MARLGRIQVALACALAVLAPVGSLAQTLSVHPSGHYLVDRQERPVFLQADSGWSLFVQLNTADAATYLKARSAAGFNAVLVNLIEHEFATNAPANAYGKPPFTGRPFATPNGAYFAHVDSILAIARQYGITLLVAPLYLGSGCGSEGWCAEVKSATTADLRSWGEYMGARYANVPNIIWVLGGDTDPTAVAPKMREMVNGILDHDAIHPWTAHNQRESWATDPWPNQTWLTLNSYYSYTQEHYEWAREGRGMLPVRPFFLIESRYENEHSVTQQQLRAAAYSSVIWGACGNIYGNCPMWHFGYSASTCGSVNWRGALSSPGTVSMSWVQRLFTSRHWWTLDPDYTNDVLTSGAGTYGEANYAVAAMTSDGSSILAYLPAARTVTIRTSSLGPDSVRVWWFRPSDGATTLVGNFRAGSSQFTPPSTSSDWVLVVDKKSLGFGAPGGGSAGAGGMEWTAPVRGMNLALSPNPLQGTGRLSFELTGDASVRVTLLDIQGRERARLADGQYSAGRVELPLESSGLEPGIYWCHVQAGGWSEQRAIVIVR